MKNRVKFLVMVLIFCVMLACDRTSKQAPLRDYTEFMVMKDGEPQTKQFPKEMAKGILHRMNSNSDPKSPDNVYTKKIVHNYTYFRYDYRAKKIDTLLNSDTVVHGFYPINKDTYYISGWLGSLKKVTADTVYSWDIPKQMPLAEPYGDDYWVSWDPKNPLMIDREKEIFVAYVIPNWNKYSEEPGTRPHFDFPRYLFFTIDGDSLRKFKHDGYFPLNHLKNNFATASIYCEYCKETSDLVFQNQYFDSVSVVNLFNDSPTRTYYMGSRLFEKPRDLSHKENMDIGPYIEYAQSTNSFGRVHYDPYRKVYLRTLMIPIPQDKEALTRSNAWNSIIIVSDLDFNIKYEVFFPASSYSTNYNLMILEEGVYLMEETKENKESYEATLFSFP